MTRGTEDGGAVGAASSFLAQVGPVLWPPPMVVGTGRAGSQPSCSWVVLARGSQPKLLLPAGSRRAAAAVALRYSEPKTRVAQLKVAALSVAFRSGLADHLLRGRLQVTVPPGARTLEDQFGEALGVECLFGLHVGPARANRKPVLTLVSSRGELLGYAKLGVNRLTSDLVRTETAALRRLGEVALNRVEVPKVLHSGVWGEGQLVVQSALPVWQRRVKETEAGRVAAMLEVAALGGTGRVRLEDSPFWRASLTGLRAATAPAAATLLDVAARLAPHAAMDVRLGAWHGDWHQSNMAVVADRFLVWDWERFAVGVPVGCDALHHDLQRAITVTKLAPSRACEELILGAPRILAPFGVASSTAPIVAAAYLLHLGARYLVDDQAGAGSRLGRLDDWLVPTLQKFAASLTPTAVRVRGQGEPS